MAQENSVTKFKAEAKRLVKEAEAEVNEYLKKFDLSAEVDWDYDFDNEYWEDAVGAYEAGSVFERTIQIGVNLPKVIRMLKKQIEEYPWSSAWEMLEEDVKTTVYHETGHGIVEQINDWLENTDDLDAVYDANKKLFDDALDEEEDTVEKFAWHFYDGLLDGDTLNEIADLSLKAAQEAS